MRAPLSVFGVLRRSLPQFNAADTFVCRKSVHNSANKTGFKSMRQTPFLNAFRSRANISRPQSTLGNVSAPSTPLSELSKTFSQQAATKKKTVFPDVSDKSVAYWLLGSAASVFGIVIFGGLTRLTESGLSITEWRPVTGSLPPFNQEKWESEFALYRASPEFKLLNPRMTLEEFKQIYWMEWIHRLWGRVIGITFLLPTFYFIARRRVTGGMALKLTGICALIGFQGVIGWWMVKSGLKDDLFAPGSHPRVSQYRLTAHLGTAFICYLAMFWNGLSILREHRLLSNPAESQKALTQMMHPNLKIFRRSVAALTLLVFVTAMSGGLVAGLDAGLIYNEFPYMGLGLTPPKTELFNTFYSHVPDHSDLWWRNILENPSLVQLDHRILATTTFTSVMLLWAYTRFNPRVRNFMSIGGQKGVRGVCHLVWFQVALGITTLLYMVPTPLASAHQAGALALLTGVMALGSRVWFPKRAAKLVAQRLTSATSQAPVARGSVVGMRGPDAMLAARTGVAAKA